MLIAVAVAMAMLLAQWIGLHHGVRHAGVDPVAVASGAVEVNYDETVHSCLIFDAATLADSVDLNPYAAPLPTGLAMRAFCAAFVSWSMPVTRHFSSRAPPSL